MLTAVLFAVCWVSASAAWSEPVEIQCLPGTTITLTVKQATLNADNQLSFTTRLYHYNNVAYWPGPTIVMYAGTRCSIAVVNALSTSTPISSCNYHNNSFHCADTTNLHTHGLHVSSAEDDITVAILPGQTYTYTYNLPIDHMPGTFWYHPHHHGASTLQVQGGMYGLLLLKNNNTNYALPTDVNNVYTNRPISMLFSHINFGGNDPNIDVSQFALLDYPHTSDYFNVVYSEMQSISPNPSYVTTVKDFFAVNGLYQPTITILPGDATLLRTCHAGMTRTLELVPETAFFTHCTMTLVARDGIFHYTPYTTITAIVLPQAVRADVVVKCAATAAGMTFNVAATPDPARNLCMGVENRHTQTSVFKIAVAASAGSVTVNTIPTSAVTFPGYLTALQSLSATVGGTNHPNGVGFQGRAIGQTSSINFVSFQGFAIPETNLKYVDIFCLNKVYEQIVGPAANGATPPGVHPYHQHVIPFQLTSVGATCDGNSVRVNEWRDTVPLIQGATIRMRPVDFLGHMLLHCHVGQHEDNGMMGMYNVTDCGIANPYTSPSATATPSPSVGSTTTTTTTDSSAVTATAALAAALQQRTIAIGVGVGVGVPVVVAILVGIGCFLRKRNTKEVADSSHGTHKKKKGDSATNEEELNSYYEVYDE